MLDAELAVGRSHAAGAAKRHLGCPVAWDLAWRIFGNLTRPVEQMWANPSAGIAWHPATPTNPPAFCSTLREVSGIKNSRFWWETSPAAVLGFPGPAAEMFDSPAVSPSPNERSVTTPAAPKESSTHRARRFTVQ